MDIKNEKISFYLCLAIGSFSVSLDRIAAYLSSVGRSLDRKPSVAYQTFLLIKQMNIYVANVPFKANDDELRELFEEFGEVSSARIIMDKFTGKSRGFAFVEMPNDDEAKQAISQLNDFDFMGKVLVVNEARPREDRPRTSGGGGFGGGGNRGGGGGFGGGGGSRGGYGGGGGGGRDNDFKKRW